MISRRGFIGAGIITLSGLSLLDRNSFAGSSESYPDNIVYSSEHPGIWGKKVGSHAPKVKVEGKKITVTTTHPMSEEHYIVRHTIVDMDGNVLGGHTFSNTDKKAESEFKLPASHGGKKMYATSFCNLHDFWITEFTL